jgi:hypothetical protein
MRSTFWKKPGKPPSRQELRRDPLNAYLAHPNEGPDTLGARYGYRF